MEHWYSKALGSGIDVFHELKRLRMIRYRADVLEQTAYQLVLDTLDARTIVFFPPESAMIAAAFGANPCRAPDFESGRLIDLGFEPTRLATQDTYFLRSVAESHPLISGGNITSCPY